MSKRIVVCLTSRGNYATLGSVLHALHEEPSIELDIIVAGASMVEKFGRLSEMLAEDGLEVTRELHNLLESGTPESTAKTTALSMLEFTNEMTRLEPDAVITIGDRYETMAVTLSASYLNIPVIHTHGGEITGSIDEKVRHATTKMADYHIVCTEQSKAIVEAMGERPERVSLTGDPSFDLPAEVLEMEGPYDPQPEYEGDGAAIDVSEPYLVVQYHPVHTDYEREYDKAREVLEAVESVDMQVFWFRPNMDAGNREVTRAIEDFREESNAPFKFYVNLHPRDYLRLVKNAACYVGNSSVGIRECGFFGQPTVNIGQRQANREQGENVVNVPVDHDEIAEAIRHQTSVGSYPRSMLYGDGNAADRVTEIIVETELTLKDPMTAADLGVETRSRTDRTYD